MLRAKRITSFVLAVLLTLSIPCDAEINTELGTGGNPFLPGAGHNFVGQITREPSCDEDGEMTYTCQDTDCNASYTTVIPNKGGHTWGDWEVTKEADCQHRKEEKRTCSECGETATRASQYGEHTWGDWNVTQQGDCETPKTEERICGLCGETEIRKGEVGGHEWGDWTDADEGDCQHKKQQKRVCGICGGEETREGDFGDHKWGDWSVVQQGDCETPKIEKHVCSVCGEEGTRESAGEGHKWGDWTVTDKGDCQTKSQEKRICSACNEEETREGDFGEHPWNNEFTVDREPTDDQEGEKSRHCTKCDERTDITPIPICNHINAKDEWIIDIEPICTEFGVKHQVCDLCGKDFNLGTSIPRIPHEFSSNVEIIKQPTCTEVGQEVKHCVLCTLDYTFEIPTTGHNPGVWQTAKAPTCTEAGFAEQRCVVCDEQINLRDIPATNHKNGYEWVVTEEPTCSEDGKKSYSCVDCGYEAETQIIAAKGHQDVHVDTIPATCTEPGLRTYECLICGLPLPDVVIEATGHKESDWIVVKAATTLAEGLQEKRCTVCDELLAQEAIEKIAGNCDPFTDVNKKAWYHEAVDFMYGSNLMSGTEATKFSPDTATSRGMFVTILGRLSGINASDYTYAYFSDVKSDSYYFGYIEWARQNGIANGTGNQTFEPDRAVTRQEMCIFIVSYAKYAGATLVNRNPKADFTDDAKIASWAKDYVYKAQRAGLVSGDASGTFRPNDTARRCETAVLIMNFYKLYMK